MASGFLILQDGRCLAVRHALHDAVLRSVAEHLPAGDPLGAWLRRQVPGDGDQEVGYGLVRTDGEQVPRFLDLRALTGENLRRFVAAAGSCQPSPGVRAPTEDVEACLHRLRLMLGAAERGEPPLALTDWRAVAPPCTDRIGPGWSEPA